MVNIPTNLETILNLGLRLLCKVESGENRVYEIITNPWCLLDHARDPSPFLHVFLHIVVLPCCHVAMLED